jgi:hypothetical protein
MVEVSLQEREGEVTRVFQVVKSNSQVFEVGFELTGEVTFGDFIEHMKRDAENDLPMEAPKPMTVPETLEEKPQPLSLVQPAMTIQELISKAEKHGFKQADIVTGAKLYHNQPNIFRLTPEQITDLDRRITARIEKRQSAQTETPQATTKQAAAAGEPGARAQATRLKRA